MGRAIRGEFRGGEAGRGSMKCKKLNCSQGFFFGEGGGEKGRGRKSLYSILFLKSGGGGVG